MDFSDPRETPLRSEKSQLKFLGKEFFFCYHNKPKQDEISKRYFINFKL